MRSTSVPAERDPPRKRARLIVLLCDTPVPPVLESKGTYADIFTTLFRRSLELRRREEPGLRDVELDIASYDVVKAGEYPDDAALEAADGLLMTGSASNAYDPLPWIDRLVSFIAQLPERHPSLSIIGICFGFQIAARALGGRCERNPAGWELGVRECSLTDLGRAVLGTERMGFVRFRPDRAPSSDASSVELRDLAIFAVQGHPEFEPDVVLKIIDVREKAGIIDADLAARSRKFAAEHDDGVAIGAVCLRILGL